MTSRYSGAMREAVRLARAHRPHPNPRVGCVLVDGEGLVRAGGAHASAGTPHAERIALEALGEQRATDLTLVVTLEPCAHQGRTPPCVDAILAAGIKRVVVGSLDPDPRVQGRGVAELRTGGVEVIVGVESDLIEEMDPGYHHHRRTGLPRVVLKTAVTLDGQIAAADGTSKWITGPEAREDAHRLRADVDAVMVGAGTLIADDPELSVRIPGYDGTQPRPIVVAGTRSLPPGAKVFARHPLILAAAPIRVAAGDVLEVGHAGRVDLRQGLALVADAGILDVLVEGGAGLAASVWHGGFATEGITYVAGRLAGGIGRAAFDHVFATLDESRPVDLVDVRRLGPDLRIDWRPRLD